MTPKPIHPKQALSSGYRLQKPNRPEVEAFKQGLTTLLGHINEKESEENLKIHLMNFLREVYYHPRHLLATKGRTDFVIHTGPDAATPAGVLVEVKHPGNKAEMPTVKHLNSKALQQAVLYYLQERVSHHNNDIRHIIITNIYEWFIFDAALFERLFYNNAGLLKQYKAWAAGQKVSESTALFYKEIAGPFIEGLDSEMEFTWLQLRDYEKPLRNQSLADDVQLIPLLKLLSPTHLLKLPFAADSNHLDRGFYTELLHIIGLEEVKEGSKKVIRRKAAAQRDEGSLIENTLLHLETENCMSRVPGLSEYGHTSEERMFSVALELCITWINRLLFLKLLEAQLMRYHHGAEQYRFLNYSRLPEYDELYMLFFQVLAKRPEERRESINKKFGHIPYLNSSLFDISPLETATIGINKLTNRMELPVHPGSVLRNAKGRPPAPAMNTLQYLFEFLDAYDFASESREGINEQGKTLINAAVLGLIFEKINGYKDGSIYTPGFITMYMCRQSIRQAVLQKFTEAYKWKADGFEDLYNYVAEDRSRKTLRAHNDLVNSLTICDPAVGSGHFLVSALNELIVVKAELGILCSPEGDRLDQVSISLESDELRVKDAHGDFFEYAVATDKAGRPFVEPWKQTVQQTLFYEKQTLIENCLFGVDINPKSVQICRLRLWIELLKNAYYINGNPEQAAGPAHHKPDLKPGKGAGAPPPPGEVGRGLQTLPNIDINIKQGNSLISRFALDEDLTSVFKQGKYSVDTYKLVVQTYKDSRSREEKEQLREFVADLKEQFRTMVYQRDPLRKKIADLRGQLSLLENNIDLFGNRRRTEKELAADTRKLTKALAEKEAELKEKEDSKIYNGAFEWRFEFPEVLNGKGEFMGFDVVIGNPPYIRQEELKEQKPYLEANYETYAGMADLFVFFVEKGMKLLRPGGLFYYILPNKWLKSGYGKALRQYVHKLETVEMIDFGDLPVFDEATTYPSLWMMRQQAVAAPRFRAAIVTDLEEKENLHQYLHSRWFAVEAESLTANSWRLMDKGLQQLLDKIKAGGKPLGDYLNGKIYYGIKTGYNEAFVIDAATRERLIAEDAGSAEIIKPFLAGRDVKRYQQPVEDKYLILFKNGFTKERFGSVSEADGWHKLTKAYPALTAFLAEHEAKGKARWDKGEFWWELRPCDYYEEFEKPKILYQEIAAYSTFVYDTKGLYTNNKLFLIPTANKALLAFLNSRLVWFYLNKTANILRGALALQSPYILALPFAAALKKHPQLNGLVDQVLAGKARQEDTAALEREIDAVVYGVYGLTEGEVGVVEG